MENFVSHLILQIYRTNEDRPCYRLYLCDKHGHVDVIMVIIITLQSV